MEPSNFSVRNHLDENSPQVCSTISSKKFLFFSLQTLDNIYIYILTPKS